MTVLVHHVTPSDGWGRWVVEEGAEVTDPGVLEELENDEWVPWKLRFDDSQGPLPAFSFIEGVPGLFVIDPYRDHHIARYSIQAGRCWDLAGEAEGLWLVIPHVCVRIDEEASEGLDLPEPTRWVLIPGVDLSLGRAEKGRPGDIFCGALLDDPAEERDPVDMEFPEWYQKSGSTGLKLVEISRSEEVWG